MDTETVLQIIERIETAKNFAKEEYQKDFECETNREYKAYVKGQCNALDGVINHLQNYIEAQVSYAENALGE